MTRGSPALGLVLALASCRSYDYHSRISRTGGLVPAEQFARYGRAQAQAAAIARRFAEARQGSSAAARTDSALAYARSQPDVSGAVADPLSYRLTVDFKSGWRLGVVPLGD